MPRPRSHSLDNIAAAALAVIDREGLDALSMRSVAAELGMATMALYRYVADRDQVERLVVDQILSTVDTEVPARASWATQATVLMERVHASVFAHPRVVPLVLAHRHRSVHSLRWMEAMLGVLTRAGLTGHRRVVALRGLVAYLTGALVVEHFSPLSGAGTSVMANLPREQYPLLTETARVARRVPPAEEFRRGLAALLRGLDPGGAA
jgi:AcrR family transcriptional regulator